MPGPSKLCRGCGEYIYAKDVAETRKVYPSNEITYLCTSCKKRHLEHYIDDERKRLGLPPRPDSRP